MPVLLKEYIYLMTHLDDIVPTTQLTILNSIRINKIKIAIYYDGE